MNFNVITGLPRSGSTLLCNILNQNENILASSTSLLPALLQTMMRSISLAPETKSDLVHNRRVTEAKVEGALRAVCESWYNGEQRIIFDKSRTWQQLHLVLRQLHPESKMIVMLRDLREVIGSLEKQHRKFPAFDASGGATLRDMFDDYFDPEKGIIGKPLKGIQDLLDRNSDVMFVRMEDLVRHPAQMMSRIYCYLLQEPFEHNFKNIEKTATDLDALYLFKFPHEGVGPVTDPGSAWLRFMPLEFGKIIYQQHNWFFKKFGYEFETLGEMKV